MGAPLEPFAELLGRDDGRIDLARACLMIAQDAYPQLDLERYLGEIERMALRLRTRMPPSSAAEDRIVALNGDAIDSFEQIREKVLPFPGRTIEVDLVRDGQAMGLTFKIGERNIRATAYSALTRWCQGIPLDRAF